jgi:hypothetical protein
MKNQKTVKETKVTNVLTAKRGRPVIEGCARQIKLSARVERIANGGSAERGRPNNPNSARQVRLALAAFKREQGIIVKAGRPKLAKTEVVKVVKEIKVKVKAKKVVSAELAAEVLGV